MIELNSTFLQVGRLCWSPYLCSFEEMLAGIAAFCCPANCKSNVGTVRRAFLAFPASQPNTAARQSETKAALCFNLGCQVRRGLWPGKAAYHQCSLLWPPRISPSLSRSGLMRVEESAACNGGLSGALSTAKMHGRRPVAYECDVWLSCLVKGSKHLACTAGAPIDILALAINFASRDKTHNTLLFFPYVKS